MGDRVHFSVNGIFTGFETPLSHIFFFFFALRIPRPPPF